MGKVRERWGSDRPAWGDRDGEAVGRERIGEIYLQRMKEGRPLAPHRPEQITHRQAQHKAKGAREGSRNRCLIEGATEKLGQAAL